MEIENISVQAVVMFWRAHRDDLVNGQFPAATSNINRVLARMDAGSLDELRDYNEEHVDDLGNSDVDYIQFCEICGCLGHDTLDAYHGAYNGCVICGSTLHTNYTCAYRWVLSLHHGHVARGDASTKAIQFGHNRADIDLKLREVVDDGEEIKAEHKEAKNDFQMVRGIASCFNTVKHVDLNYVPWSKILLIFLYFAVVVGGCFTHFYLDQKNCQQEEYSKYLISLDIRMHMSWAEALLNVVTFTDLPKVHIQQYCAFPYLYFTLCVMFALFTSFMLYCWSEIKYRRLDTWQFLREVRDHTDDRRNPNVSGCPKSYLMGSAMVRHIVQQMYSVTRDGLPTVYQPGESVQDLLISMSLFCHLKANFPNFPALEDDHTALKNVEKLIYAAARRESSINIDDMNPDANVRHDTAMYFIDWAMHVHTANHEIREYSLNGSRRSYDFQMATLPNGHL